MIGKLLTLARWPVSHNKNYSISIDLSDNYIENLLESFYISEMRANDASVFHINFFPIRVLQSMRMNILCPEHDTKSFIL